MDLILPDGLVARPLTLDDADAVCEVMAASETFELGPDEQGNPPDGIQRVLRFTAGGLED